MRPSARAQRSESRPRDGEEEDHDQRLEALAGKHGYDVEREDGGTVVLRPEGSATATRYPDEKQAKESLAE